MMGCSLAVRHQTDGANETACCRLEVSLLSWAGSISFRNFLVYLCMVTEPRIVTEILSARVDCIRLFRDAHLALAGRICWLLIDDTPTTCHAGQPKVV